MTDARFPERWLNDRRVLRLSDVDFRTFVTTLRLERRQPHGRPPRAR